MPAGGTVQVKLTSWHAAAVSRWLLSDCVIAALDKAGSLHQAQIPHLVSLAGRLDIAARRRHKKRLFTVPIPKEEAIAFASIQWPAVHRKLVIDPSGIAGTGLHDLRMKSVHRRILAVLALKKGRRTLSRGSMQLRIVPSYKMIEDRQRKKLRAREKRAGVWPKFYAEMTRRGETLLTTSLPVPDFP